jgi:DNA-directed RNA polymerase specialized sigma24 family protein
MEPDADKTRDTVEGQVIAQGMLRRDEDAGREFVATYQHRLLILARKCLVQSPDLGRVGTVEDLVQDFLTEKLFRRLHSMLAPVAAGKLPLRPRLHRSFRNYCTDKLRPMSRWVDLMSGHDLAKTVAGKPDSEQDTPSVLDSVGTVSREQADCIRQAFSETSRDRVPYPCLLLLSERLHWVELLVKAFVLEDDSLPASFSPAELAELLQPWTSAEDSTSIGASGANLVEAWRGLKCLVAASPFGVESDEIGRLIGVAGNTWDKWIQRARAKVTATICSAESQRLFRHWPHK